MDEPALPPTPSSEPPGLPPVAVGIAPWRRAAGIAMAAVSALLVVSALGLAALAGAWRHEAGSHWLLTHVPGLTVSGVRGSLGGGDLRLTRLRFIGGGVDVTATEVTLQGLALRWHPAPGQWLGVQVDGVGIGRAGVRLVEDASAREAPARTPTSLRSPVRLDLERLRIGRLDIADLPPLRALEAGLHLGDRAGALHRVSGLRFAWERLQASSDIALAADAPFAVQGHLEAHGTPAATGAAPAPVAAPAPASSPNLVDRLAWQATATLRGPLAALDADAVLSGTLRAGRAPAALQAHARLTPFAALPLSALQLSTRELDLNALYSRAPATRLQGTVNARQAPTPQARVDLRNLAPAAWSDGGLPIAAVTGRLEPVPHPATDKHKDQAAALTTWQALNLPDWRIDFADARGAAGFLRATGAWSGATARARIELGQVQTARLDGRLAAWTLDGRLDADIDGLAGSAWGSARIAADLSALRAGTQAPARLALKTTWKPAALEIENASLTLGPARATAQGRFVRQEPGFWQGKAQADWNGVDPGAWWPLATRPPASAVPPNLNGHAALRLDQAPVEWRGLAGLRGQLTATLDTSRWAGTPLSGELTLDAGPARWDGKAALRSGANEARAELAAFPTADGPGADKIHLSVNAPALADLAALGASLPTAAGAWPSAGQVKLDLDAGGLRLLDGAPSGPGATLASRGEISGWKSPSLQFGRLNWNLQAGTDPQAPLQGRAQLQDLRRGQVRVDGAELELSGRLADHRLRLHASAPLRPPAWIAVSGPGMATAWKADAPTQLDALVRGRWSPTANGTNFEESSVWQGRLDRFTIGPGLASAPFAASAASSGSAAWLSVQPVDARIGFDDAGAVRSARLEAGRLDVAGLAWSWSAAEWAAASRAEPGAPSRWHLDGSLAPFPVAPLLARLQPDFGWHGDLTMGARWQARFDGAWHVAAELGRVDGDLRVADETDGAGNAAAQRLGISVARLGLRGEAGLWRAEAHLAGSGVGVLDATAQTQSATPAQLPATGAPLQGRLGADVADLGVWGAWLPPGWRLGGSLAAEVALGGRVGAPDFSGRLQAHRFALRNALQGVFAHDGEIEVSLAGDRARIERFQLQAGAGQLGITGGAVLGAAPQATLRAQATQFQLLGSIDRRLVASGAAELHLAPQRLDVRGQLRVDEGLFDIGRGDAPALDNDVEVLDPSAPDTSDRPGAAPEAPGRAIHVDLALDLGDRLKLRGHGIDTLLAGKLQLSAPNGQPALRGQIRTVQGQYAAYGQKLEIRRGDLDFTGPPGDPRLDILAVRPDLDVVVGVAISGSALQPRVKLFSEPEMADIDKLSWLMLGRAPDTLGRSDTALLQRAAVALLAGEGESPTDTFMHRLGLTDFSFRQDGDGDVRATVVSLGRQLNKRWYLGYERGVNATTGTWQLIYRIAQRITVRAQSGSDNSLDVIWAWRWN